MNSATKELLLSPESIAKLKEIYRDAYNKELSDDAAWEMGHRLASLYYKLTVGKSNPQKF